MKTVDIPTGRPVAVQPLPEDYVRLCQRYLPRPLRDDDDYAEAWRAIEPLAGFEDRLTRDQADYLEAISTFIEAYDRERVKWPRSSPLETLRFLAEEHRLSAAELARLLAVDRSLASKLLRGERRLTIEHIRKLAAHFCVEAGLFIGE
jgi:HTH-type transcriptional regulator/antitoxin HigA